MFSNSAKHRQPVPKALRDGAPIRIRVRFAAKRTLVRFGLSPGGRSRYNVFMWGRIIIGAVVVVLVAVWLLAIWFLIADPRVIMDSRMGLPKLPTW